MIVSKQIVGKYTVKVINEKCIGAASCAAIAPGTFVMNEDDIAEVISQQGDSDEFKLLGAQSCPTAAIIVTDTQTGKQVWPILDDSEF
jgi:ferredoxin